MHICKYCVAHKLTESELSSDLCSRLFAPDIWASAAANASTAPFSSISFSADFLKYSMAATGTESRNLNRRRKGIRTMVLVAVQNWNSLMILLRPTVKTVYLTASFADDLMMSLAVGTPTRLNVMPWQFKMHFIRSCTFITKILFNYEPHSTTYCFVFYVAQLVLFFPLVEADTDSSPACSTCASWPVDVRLHILKSNTGMRDKGTLNKPYLRLSSHGRCYKYQIIPGVGNTGSPGPLQGCPTHELRRWWQRAPRTFPSWSPSA